MWRKSRWTGTAYGKVLRGEKPTKQERAALTRFERKKEEKLRWAYYASIPQKHWRKMSGRQAKVLIEQADRYGLPFGGPKINLPAVVRALHDFLAENARRLAADDDMLNRVAALLRGAGETLQRQFGPEAFLVFNEALDEAEREIDTFFEEHT